MPARTQSCGDRLGGQAAVEAVVEAVGRGQIPAVHGFAADRRRVERGDELHRRPGAGQRGVVAAAGEHVVHQLIDLRRVVAGQIRPGGGGPDLVPACRPRISATAGARQTGITPETGGRCRVRRGRPRPVGIAVAVDVIDLERSAVVSTRMRLSSRGESRLVTTVPMAPLANVTMAIDTSSNSTGRAIRAARASTVSHGPIRWRSRSI